MTKSRAAAVRARDEGGLEFNPGYLGDPEATIMLRVGGPGFDGLPVSEGDLVIADRGVKPGDGDLVVAVVGGGMVVRRFSAAGGLGFLCAGDGSRVTVGGTDGGTEILAAVVAVIPITPE